MSMDMRETPEEQDPNLDWSAMEAQARAREQQILQHMVESGGQSTQSQKGFQSIDVNGEFHSMHDGDWGHGEEENDPSMQSATVLNSALDEHEEQYTKLRIKNRLISAQEVQENTLEHTFIPISKLSKLDAKVR